MSLTDTQRTTIRDEVQRHFGDDARVLLFDSWVRDEAGDSDITGKMVSDPISCFSAHGVNDFVPSICRTTGWKSISHDGLLASIDSIFLAYPEIDGRLIAR